MCIQKKEINLFTVWSLSSTIEDYLNKKMNKYISVQGAREHNLKNVNVKIPREKITIITGLSGSCLLYTSDAADE